MQKGQDKGKIALSLLVTSLVVLFDQLSKLWVRANSPQMELLPGFLNLVHLENYGASFGLFANQTFLLITITIASLVVILMFLHHLSPSRTLSIVSVGLILGGAVGNLIDRLRCGCVTDFIEIHIQHIFYWPAFNLADSAIVIGIILFIFSLYQSGLFKKIYKHGHKSAD